MLSCPIMFTWLFIRAVISLSVKQSSNSNLIWRGNISQGNTVRRNQVKDGHSGNGIFMIIIAVRSRVFGKRYNIVTIIRSVEGWSKTYRIMYGRVITGIREMDEFFLRWTKLNFKIFRPAGAGRHRHISYE